MTEEEYQEALKRLVKGAEYLSNPLIKPEDYERGMRLYDSLTREILKYRGMEWAINE